MSSVDLGTAPLSRLFLRYVTPTVAAMLVTGIYVTIDGIFVGHILGQDGLAGMMLAYPICAVLYAVGALIGMGSSSLASFYLGKGEQARARHIVGNALVMVLIASALLAFIGIRYGKAMLVWMGAQGVIFDAGFAYLQWYAWLGVFAVLSMAFTALLRNDGRPGLTTWILVGGGVLNVLLDYLLMAVIPWGLAGAAIATMLSQAVTGGLCLWHFFTPRSQLRIRWDTLVPDWRLMGETLRLGVSSFLMYLYLSVVLALHNKALLAVGTSLHVAAYGVISYSEAFFYLIFEGIAMGIQPIASFNAGAGNWCAGAAGAQPGIGSDHGGGTVRDDPAVSVAGGSGLSVCGGQCCPVAGGEPRYLALLLGAAHGRLAAGGGHLLPGHQPGPHRFPAHRRQAGADRRFPVGLLLPVGSGRCLAGAAHLQHSAGPGDVAGDEQGGAPAQRCLRCGHASMKKVASAAFFILSAPACGQQVAGLRA